MTRNPGRFAGLLYVLMSIPGFFALIYVPSKLIAHGNATATANNIAASETLFRLLNHRVNLVTLKETKARRKGADTVI
jgi:hypothetical protein